MTGACWCGQAILRFHGRSGSGTRWNRWLTRCLGSLAILPGPFLTLLSCSSSMEGSRRPMSHSPVWKICWTLSLEREETGLLKLGWTLWCNCHFVLFETAQRDNTWSELFQQNKPLFSLFILKRKNLLKRLKRKNNKSNQQWQLTVGWSENKQL